jgi:hypothetical protein
MRRLILPKVGQPASAPSCGSPPHSILMQFSPITIMLSYMIHTALGGSRRLTLYRDDPAGRAREEPAAPMLTAARKSSRDPHEPSGPKNRMFSHLVALALAEQEPGGVDAVHRAVGRHFVRCPASAANELYQS